MKMTKPNWNKWHNGFNREMKRAAKDMSIDAMLVCVCCGRKVESGAKTVIVSGAMMDDTGFDLMTAEEALAFGDWCQYFIGNDCAKRIEPQYLNQVVAD